MILNYTLVIKKLIYECKGMNDCRYTEKKFV